MKNLKCYITSGLTLILTAIITFSPIMSRNEEITLLLITLIFAFPIAIYISYLYSNINKLHAFFIAFLNDFLCLAIPLGYSFANHKSSSLEMLITIIILGIRIFIALIFAVIYFVKHKKGAKQN
jgi:hypothetical protein